MRPMKEINEMFLAIKKKTRKKKCVYLFLDAFPSMFKQRFSSVLVSKKNNYKLEKKKKLLHKIGDTSFIMQKNYICSVCLFMFGGR